MNNVLLTLAVVLQAGFWYLATPGPFLSGSERSLSNAIIAVGWSFLFLFAVPYLAARLAKYSPAVLGLRLGDIRTGARIVGIAALVAAPVLYFGSNNAILQASYPWPGEWINSVGTLLAWIPFYAVYYVAFEFFYRGYLLQVANKAFGMVAAQWFQALAATLIHAGKPLPEFLLALPASLFFGWLAVRTKSLVWPILLHLAIGIITDVSVVLRTGGFG